MKVGRNRPCPCGSGRKFKRCCMDETKNFQAGLFDFGEEELLAGQDNSAPEFEDDAVVAQAIVALIARGGPDALTPTMHEYLAENFDLLPHFLDGFLAAANEPDADANRDLLAAYEYLLEGQLTNLRYALECGYDWAREMIDSFEARLIGAIRSGEAARPQIVALSSAMFQARLEPGPELVAASEERFIVVQAEEFQADPDTATLFASIAEQCGGDPFAIHEALFAASHIGSATLRGYAARALLEAPDPAIREAAALAVLDPDPDVRRATAAMLRDNCRAITPAALRRLITLRRWVAAPERELMDQAVKAARLAGIQCAQWAPGAAVAEIHASTPDGSGAQAAMIVTKAGRDLQLSGLLFKQGKGITDAWTMEPQSRSAIKRMLKPSSSGIHLFPVSSRCLDRAVGYYLRCGLEQNMVPGARLLAAAEALQAPQWQPAPEGWRELLAELIGEVPDKLLALDSVRAIIASSATWAMSRRWAESWAEQGQEVSDLLDNLEGRPMEVVLDTILKTVIEKRRAIWAERFTLTALCMKEAISRERLPWEKFAIVAQKLVEEVPLREIPLMSEIAEATAFL